MHVFLAVALLAAAPAEEADRALASVVKERLLERLAKPLDLKHSLFTGTVVAVDAAKNLNVTARGVSLSQDTGSATLSVGGEWLLVGKLKLGDMPTAVKLQLKATIDVTGSVQIVKKKKTFLARPTIKDIGLASSEVVSLVPEPFVGARLAMPALLSTLLRANKSALLKDLADTIENVELPRAAMVSEVESENDNPVLRQYAQAMIADWLTRFGSEKDGFPIDERTPFLEATGKVWFDAPAKSLKVRITRLDLRDGVAYVGGFVDSPVRGLCNFRGGGLGIVQGTADVAVQFRLDFDGDLEMKDGKPGGCNIYRLAPTLAAFDSETPLFRPLRRVLDGLVSRLVSVKAAEVSESVAKRFGGPRRERLIESAYQRVLGRAADERGMHDWSVYLATRTPRQLLVALASSPEYETSLKGKSAKEMARALWRVAMGRDAGPLELVKSTAFLQEREKQYEEKIVRVRLRLEKRRVVVGSRPRTSRDLLIHIAESEEYRTRFGEGLPR